MSSRSLLARARQAQSGVLLHPPVSAILTKSPSASLAFSTTATCCSTTSLLSRPHDVELKIPWGKIVGKQWTLKHPRANKDKVTETSHDQDKPVSWLGLHGLMDNLGTFDTLLPHLPAGLQVILPKDKMDDFQANNIDLCEN